MKKFKRIFSLLLACVMSFSIITGSMPFAPRKVLAEGNVFNYDFKQDVTKPIEVNQWEVIKNTLPDATPSYRNQVYGLQIQTANIGQYLTLNINVPVSGIYTFSLNGGGYSSGGLATVLIDGQEVGEYDFNGKSVVAKGVVSMRTYEMTAGIHKLIFKVKAKTGNYNMYPGLLTLTEVPSLKDIQTMDIKTVPAYSEMMVGQSTMLILQGTMSDGFLYNYSAMPGVIKTFVNSDPSVAAVDETGKLTALKTGTTTLTASVELGGNKIEKIMVVTVNNKVLGKVSLTADKPTIVIDGAAAKLTVKGMLDDGTAVDIKDAAIAFSSTSSAIAVSAAGIVTPVQAGVGVAHVDVTLGGVTRSADCTITVKEPELASAVLSFYKSSVFVGDLLQPSLAGTLNNGKPVELSSASVTYSSDNASVINVIDGNITAVSAGTAKITATVSSSAIAVNCSATATVSSVTSCKTKSTIYTPEKIANAVENAGKYSWAANTRDGAVSKADGYLALGYDYIWSIITPQSIPRSYGVNQALGSPVTGKEIDKYGNYPYIIDAVNKPWKIKDPSSGYYFPTNDFKSYYESGLDEHGIFDPKHADRKYLVNELYPEKGLTWGVDDGYGWVDEKGNKYTFIAYYNHMLWYTDFIGNALTAFTDAYAYTGDMKYAKAGLIMLDRIADVYPDMKTSAYPLAQGFMNSDGGSGQGKILGCIWETSLATKFARAYDAFFPVTLDESQCSEVISFLSSKSTKYKLGVLKSSAVGIRRNIEDNILRQINYGFRNALIRGNNGMHQNSLATAAVVLDSMPETKEWLDYDFQSGSYISTNPQKITGGNIKALLVNDVDRDGNGNEAAPGYNKLWITQFLDVANVLDGYALYPDADLYKDVKFRKMFSAMYPLMMSDVYGAAIGDTGTTGGPIGLVDRAQTIKAFEKFRDPVFAQLVHHINNYSTEGIHSDIFTKDPEAIAGEIQAIVKQKGTLKLDSSNLTGFGFTALRDGVNNKRYFGKSIDFLKMTIADTNTFYKAVDASNTLQLENGSDATAVGKYIAFKFNVDKADTYEVDLNPFRAASYGIYSVELDGRLLPENIDFYGMSGASSKLVNLGKMDLASGEHTIKFTCVGKNPDVSTGYKMGVISLVLFDKEALAIRDSENNVNGLRDLWMYYGKNNAHGHRDTLNIGIHGFGLDLAPDLGYPETADNAAHRHEWVKNTISHNTVVVNKSMQNESLSGLPQHFYDGDLVKLIDVKAPKAYTSTQDYRRTTAMIKVDDVNSYYVDFFRVVGGNDHQFSFHSTDGTVKTEGLELVPQKDENGQYVGSYEGPSVPWGSTGTNSAGYTGSGFHWLKNVDRDTDPDNIFSVDWDIKDNWGILGANEDVHLKLTMLGDVDEVSLADGVPPRNKGTNPESLRYMIARRSGTNISSNFTSVIEPYKNSRYIETIAPAAIKTADGQPVDSSSTDVKAVKVALANGRTDYVVYSVNPDVLYTIDDKFTFKGFFGVYSEWEGAQDAGFVADGTEIGPKVPQAVNALTGKVVDFTRTLSVQNEIRVSVDQTGFNADNLAGSYIYVDNDNVRNGSYRIEKAVANVDGTVTLDIGDVTTVRQWANNADFSKGFIYDIAPNAAFRIPLSAEYTNPVPKKTLKDLVMKADKLELKPSATATIKLSGVMNDGSANDLSWAKVIYTSSNEQVVTVDNNGNVAAVNEGDAQITAVVNLHGVVKTARLNFCVDGTAPACSLNAGDKEITEGTSFDDCKLVTFTSKDPNAGLFIAYVTIDGTRYSVNSNGGKVEINLAGKPGKHTAVIYAADNAGNILNKEIHFNVTTSIASMKELVSRYKKSGDLSSTTLNKLLELNLNLAQGQVDRGMYKVAAVNLKTFTTLLNSKAWSKYVKPEAKTVLNADAAYLINDWAKKKK